MRREFSRDRNGRIPFAYVAIVIMLLSVGVSSFMLGQDEEYSKEKTKESSKVTFGYQDLSSLDLETKVYYIMHEVLGERMTVPLDNDTKELDLIDEMVRDRLSDLISEEYPRTEGIFNIHILEWDINVLLDEMNTSALLKETKSIKCGRTYVMDNSTISELETAAPPFVQATSKAVYFRLVGHAKYRIHNMDEDITIEKYSTFNKNVYSPLPLMKNLALRFQSDSSGEFSSVGRMIRYMITTLAQYRVLCGYAGGGYGGPNNGKEITDVITKKDVEIAVNLALLLTQARYYRDFDRETARGQTASNDPGRDIEKLMDNYVNNGSVDPADLIALYTDLENLTLDPGRIFAQSIFSFADRFVWELLELFWGEEWDPEGDENWDNEKYFDPTLDEPIVDWEEIEGKSDTENWCKDRLMKWLEVFGKWLGITETGDENGEIVKIETQQEESVVIKDIYARYRHPPNAGDVAGTPSGADLCNVAIPPPGYGVPDYYVMGTDAYHVDGRYYLFGDATDSTSSNKRWYVRSYVRPEESSPGDTTDARHLILGESPGVGGDEGRPYTYKMICRDDWGSGVPEKTYEYYLVKESLLEKHKDYTEAGLSYYNTLRFIVDALTRSMKQQPSNINNFNSKGMTDYAAYVTEVHFEERETDLSIDPKDRRSILSDDLTDIVRKDGGAISDALVDFEDFASQEKENWFRQGAYLNDSENPDDSGEYFLYELISETVDLWYEMLVNLYDGGYREFDENGDSSYGPQDGPNHWNNYEQNPNSQLPEERFQTSSHETESGSDKPAGSFKFRNDALRDCYYRVMEIVRTRDDAVEFSFSNWEDLGSSHWIWTVKGSCGQAGILYGWMPSGTGIVAVPIQDQQMIPRESYDGSGSVEDLTPSDEPWKNSLQTYAEPIWDILKNGNSGQTNLANNDFGEGIAVAVGNIVGWSSWPETTNEGLLDDVKAELIEGSGGQGGLDQLTDEGTYGSSGNSYDFNSDFYDFVKRNVGREFLPENALWDQLSQENGWLAQIIKTETFDRLQDNLDVFNIPFTSASRLNVPWEFWHGDRNTAIRNGSLFSEELVVDQIPDKLAVDSDHLDIEIKVPINGTHFVDVQDLEFPMSKDCFTSVWLVNISADVKYKIRNSRLSSIGLSDHDYFWYNHSVQLDIDFPVPIYSGWDLESGWQTEDIDYRMTRRYFQKSKEDTPTDPFFASKALVETVDASRDAADWMMDTKTAAQHFIVHSPMMGTKEKSSFLSYMTRAMTRAADPRSDEEGLLEAAAANNDYITNISQSATKLNDLGLSEMKINYFGYDAVYYTATNTLEITRGVVDSETNDTGLKYLFRFDGDMTFTGKYRIRNQAFFDYRMAGSPADFSITGQLSPYNMRENGLVHNFSVGTGADFPLRYSAAAPVENLFLPLLGTNATVRIGIISSIPIPEELKSSIENIKRFELEEHRGAALMGQCENYIKYFLGVLYNKQIDTLKTGNLFGITFNVTPTAGIQAGYINKTYGIDLTGLSTSESEKVLRLFVKHLINNTFYCLNSLMEPAVSPSFFLKMPSEVMPYLVHEIYHWEDGGDICWQGTIAHTMTTTPYVGSPGDAGDRTFSGGKLYPSGARYLLRYEINAGK